MTRIKVGLVATAAVLVLAGVSCLGSEQTVKVVDSGVEPGPGTEPVGTSTVTPETSAVTVIATVDAPSAPYTGLRAADTTAAGAPALVVKIDNNNGRSRPQEGLVEADIVYEVLIEGLKTRFAALFQSRVPSQAGPVRSARTTDVDLFVGLGRPTLVFSGANPPTLLEISRAADAGVFVDAGALRREDPYFRLDSRSVPYNLWVELKSVDTSGSGVPSPILHYGGLPEGAGSEIGGVEIAYQASFGRKVSHLWDPAVAGWVRVQDGTLHTVFSVGREVEIAPVNVVVAQVVYEVSPADSESPEARSFGTGPVQVFSRGRMVEGTWSRSPQSPVWDLRTANGEIIGLQPGATWLILASSAGSEFPEARVATFDPVDATAQLEAARARKIEDRE